MFKIGMVDHPRADLMKELNKPTQYLALICTYGDQPCHRHMRSSYNMDCVDEYLKFDYKHGWITTLEYLEAMSLIKEYRDGQNRSRQLA
jgi:hypothetical protein